jgi:hypothetical protein
MLGLRRLILDINIMPRVPYYQSKRHFTIMKRLYRDGDARNYLKSVPDKYIRKYEGLVRGNPSYFRYRKELKRIIKEMNDEGIDSTPMTVITIIWKDTYFDL